MRYSVEKKWIEHNKKEFGVEIIELKKIISEQVRKGGKSDEFTSDMLVALVTGRKITPKMKDAIDNIIKENEAFMEPVIKMLRFPIPLKQ